MKKFLIQKSFQIDNNTCERADKFLSAKLAGVSRSEMQNYIENGSVLVNGKKISKSRKLLAGDEVVVEVLMEEEKQILPQDIPLDIIFEDEDIVVVNKEKGMLVHPTDKESEGSLVNALLFHTGGKLSYLSGENRPGIVHRLDRDTSGLMVIAKTDMAYEKLWEQSQNKEMLREYLAVITGRLSPESGEIDVPITRGSGTKRRVAEDGKEAITYYEVLEEYKNYSFIRVRLITGRTHQIRVHMHYKSAPVAGDKLYKRNFSRREEKLDGQCLHAEKLGFIHPITGEYLEFVAEVPQSFNDFLNGVKTDA